MDKELGVRNQVSENRVKIEIRVNFSSVFDSEMYISIILIHLQSQSQIISNKSWNVFISQNWACWYEEQFDFKEAVEKAEK
jgi:hypothetical protein